MIEITGIVHKSLAIKSLNLKMGHTAIIGPNGSGKTTLLELCSGMSLPSSGDVAIDGKNPRKCDVGWVAEFPDRNRIFEQVFDEIASPLRFMHIPCAEVETRVQETASIIGITRLLDASTRKISGGEKALVALATACVTAPLILVLDEVDSHLDGRSAKHLQEIIRQSSSAYVLQCTQNMDTAAGADCVVYLENGKVVHCGSPEGVFMHLKESCYYPPSWRIRECR